MDVLNVVDKIYTATINFVRRFNSEKVVFKLKVTAFTIATSKQQTPTSKQHFLVSRKSDKCRLRSTPQALNTYTRVVVKTTRYMPLASVTYRENTALGSQT